MNCTDDIILDDDDPDGNDDEFKWDAGGQTDDMIACIFLQTLDLSDWLIIQSILYDQQICWIICNFLKQICVHVSSSARKFFTFAS